jgi:imidazolonepropionase-like amidohydrolase
VDLLVADVHVVDVEAGRVLEDRSVGVADGRIVAVWPADGTPAGLEVGRRLEAEGRYLIPGLWDSHVHFRGGPELREGNRALLPLYPAFGVTTVRDAGGDLTGDIMAWRDSIRAGELLGPEIFTSGPKLDGPRPSWDGSIALSSPDEVPAAVDSLQALGVDYVKLYDGTMSADVFLAAVRETERRGVTVTGHMPLGVDFLEAVEAGYDGTEHLYYAYKGTASNREEISARVDAGELGFWNAFWEMLGRRDPAREAEVAAAMRERGAVMIPTLHIGDVLGSVELVDHTSDYMLPLIPEEIQATYARRVNSARRSPPEVRENSRRLRAEMAEFWKRMHDAGVTTLAGSDAGPFNSFVYPGHSLHEELFALVAAGMTPAEALRSATVLPARFMGVDDRVGRIEPGYEADMVVLDANPLEDIRAISARNLVVLRGETVLTSAEMMQILGAGR